MRDPIKTNNYNEWLKQRSTFIGSSEILVAIGQYNKYRSPLDVYNEKINGAEYFDNDTLWFGRNVEPVCAKWLEQRCDKYKGVVVEDDGYTRFHSKYDFIGTTVDGICHMPDRSKAILEIKTARASAVSNWGAELPLQYYGQIQIQMAITGIQKAIVVLCVQDSFEGIKFETQEYEYYPEFAEQVINKCVDFWYNHIVPKHPPEATTNNDIKQLYPEANGHSLEASPELADKIRVLKNLKATKNEMDKNIKGIELDIKKLMKDAQSITYGEDTLATWKNNKPRTSFNQKEFKEDHPDLYQKYIKESGPIRVLRLK